MIIIKLIYRFLSYFQSHSTHQGLALGIAVGMLLGLNPINSVQFWIFLTFIFLLKLNLSTTLASSLIFWLIRYLGKNAFFVLGEFLLNKKSLLAFWSYFYHLPILPFTNFYIPDYLGEIIVSLFLFIPLHLFSLKLIKVLEPFLYHWWRTTKLYMIYRGYKPYAR